MARPMARGAVSAVAAPGVAQPSDVGALHLRDVFRYVEWTPPFIAFLLYVFIIISYEFPGATIVIPIALLTLPLQRSRLRFPPFLFLLSLLVAWGFMSATQSDWRPLSIAAAQDLGRVILITFVAVNAVRTRAQVRFFILFLLAVVALYPVRGALFNFFVYHASTMGRVAWNHIFENPNDLAGLLLVPFGLSLGIWATERKRQILWWCALVGAVVLPLVIVFTQSRGGLLGGVSLVAFALLAHRNKFGAVLLVGAAAGVIAMFAPDSAITRLLTLRQTVNVEALGDIQDYGSARQRYELWKVARTIVSENPALGVGPGAYNEAHGLTARRGQFNRTALGRRSAHSTYLTIMAELGYPGFLLWVGAILAVLLGAEVQRRRARPVLPARAQQLLFAEIGFIAFLIAGAFGTYGSLALFYLYLAVVYVLSQALREEVDALAPAMANPVPVRNGRRSR